MMDEMTVEAPAKLNLSLKILGKREDGFHELESLMVRLPALHDRLEISKSETDLFSCSDPTVPADDSNLVLKALKLFRAKTDRFDPVSVRLEKCVPHGAGLGGGSSDAAATLVALNEMLNTELGLEELCEIGAQLGSDVPFFIGAPVARVAGRGERLLEADPLPSLPVLLLKPDFGVPTPDAYRRWRDSKELPEVNYSAQKGVWGELVNDLERPVFEKFRFLAEMKQWLLVQAGVKAALMSGSGSTMFAVLDDLQIADELTAGAKCDLDPKLWSWSGWTATNGP